MNKIIEDLEWRYATKKFDATKKVSTEDLETLKSSLQLTPTSYGLQAQKFVIVENPEIREKLVEVSWGQRQVADASHLFVLCAYADTNDTHVDAYMNRVSKTRNIPVENLEGFGNMIKGTLAKLTDEQAQTWISKQVYIALGQLMHTAATLRIDATPMEGFEAEKVNEILGLKEHNLTAVLLCPVGYRHEEDANQHAAKVRKTKEELFVTI